MDRFLFQLSGYMICNPIDLLDKLSIILYLKIDPQESKTTLPQRYSMSTDQLEYDSIYQCKLCSSVWWFGHQFFNVFTK